MLLGLAATTPLACTLELDDHVICGDGFVDVDADEECEPRVPSSFDKACEAAGFSKGLAYCDPLTCLLDDSEETCAACNDSVLSPNEECDGNLFHEGDACPAGGHLQCTNCRLDYSACETCGNGELDFGEECDPALVGMLTMGKPDCTELISPVPSKPYASGQPARCLDNCLWERAGCTYCGDGSLDADSLAVDYEGNFETLPEVCDGSDYDTAALEAKVTGSACLVIDENARPIVECSSDCLEIIPQNDCCLEAFAECPSAGDTLRCCFEEENPQVAEPCVTIHDTSGDSHHVCRPW